MMKKVCTKIKPAVESKSTIKRGCPHLQLQTRLVAARDVNFVLLSRRRQTIMMGSIVRIVVLGSVRKTTSDCTKAATMVRKYDCILSLYHSKWVGSPQKKQLYKVREKTFYHENFWHKPYGCVKRQEKPGNTVVDLELWHTNLNLKSTKLTASWCIYCRVS